MRNVTYSLSTTDKAIVYADRRGGVEAYNIIITNTNSTTVRLVTVQLGTSDSKKHLYMVNIPAKCSLNLLCDQNSLFLPHKKSIFAKQDAGTDVDVVVNYRDVQPTIN